MVMLSAGQGTAQRPSVRSLAATQGPDLRASDAFVERARRDGGLRARRTDRDPSLPERTIERLQQYHQGVPVWGSEVVRDSRDGVPLAIFGDTAADLSDLGGPGLSGVQASAALLAAVGDGARLIGPPTLVVARDDGGGPRLAYMGIASAETGVWRVFVDATTGAELERVSELQTQSAVGVGRGVIGDEKKISARAEAGAYFADDVLRPPQLRTFDMRGLLARTIEVVDGAALSAADRATDTDNVWTDAVAVDAHAHIGWTYDYYFKRHGRQGLDGRNRSISTLINALTQEAALTVPGSVAGIWVLNAFWCGECGPSATGLMFFGNGIPSNFFLTSTGQNYGPLAGSLDVAAHELTHGVIESSSNLIYRDESGALDEAFADIMGTSVEFFYQAPGAGRGQADYLIAEDTVRAVRAGALNGIRSLADPGRYDDPDHYSLRYTGPLDNGGVHINSGIASHAFYLAIEGGTHRTSGLTVEGVGAANRELIEKVFYRAFVFLLTPSATFSSARAATIQAARDLYGLGSAPERAVTQAWAAVGVS